MVKVWFSIPVDFGKYLWRKETTTDEISTQKDKTNIHGQYIIHHCFQEVLRKIVNLFEQLLKD